MWNKVIWAMCDLFVRFRICKIAPPCTIWKASTIANEFVVRNEANSTTTATANHIYVCNAMRCALIKHPNVILRARRCMHIQYRYINDHSYSWAIRDNQTTETRDYSPLAFTCANAFLCSIHFSFFWKFNSIHFNSAYPKTRQEKKYMNVHRLDTIE